MLTRCPASQTNHMQIYMLTTMEATCLGSAQNRRRSVNQHLETSLVHQRRETMLPRVEALAAFSLSLDNSISIFAWIFSQSTST